MTERLVGYAILFLGIGIMIFATLQVYLVFTNKAKPYSIFNTSAPSFNLRDLLPSTSQLDPNVLSKVGDKKLEVISTDTLNLSLNLTIHFFLMSFLLTLGFKLGSLGVMLIRPIVLKLRSHGGENFYKTENEPIPDTLKMRK